MSTTFAPPEQLPTGERVHPVLLVPFGEEISRAHEDRGRVFSWGDAPHLPRKDIAVDVDHDGEFVGHASAFTLTSSGVWAVIKAGFRAERLINQGYTGVSVETDNSGTIIGVSLTRTPAFRSARVVFRGDIRTFTGGVVLDSPVRFGIDVATGRLAFAPPPAPAAPVELLPAAANMSEANDRLAAVQGPDVGAEVEFARAREADRLASLAESRTDWEQVLVETAARNKTVFEAQLVAADGLAAAAEWKARHEALEAQAERERRPWWRRLVR